MKAKIFAAVDPILALTVMALLGLGLVMVFSASSALALSHYGDPYFFLRRQAFSAGVGLCALIALACLPYTWYRQTVYLLLFAGAVLMTLVFLPHVGHEVGGARRWIQLGRLSFQPSEVVKLVMVLYLAYSLSKKGDKVRDLSVGYVPHMIILGLFVVLVLGQKDLGTCGILILVTMIMLFVAGSKVLHLFITSMVGCTILGVAVWLVPYRFERLLAFLNPWEDPLGRGFQIVHSFMAFGTGGILGVGIGEGKQKLLYLPEPHTDFIFSVLGEELGLVGVAATVALYALFFWRSIRIAGLARDAFGSMLAFGLAVLVSLQAIINMSVVMGLVPTKGLPLPFLSYGGSALVLNLCAVGILFSIRARAQGG